MRSGDIWSRSCSICFWTWGCLSSPGFPGLGLLRTLFQILYHGILWGPVWDAFGAEAHATWYPGKGILHFRLQHAVHSWLKLPQGSETISSFGFATCQATKGAWQKFDVLGFTFSDWTWLKLLWPFRLKDLVIYAMLPPKASMLQVYSHVQCSTVELRSIICIYIYT